MKRIREKLLNAASPYSQAGKAGWILLWLLGVPIPVLIVLFLVRGCT